MGYAGGQFRMPCIDTGFRDDRNVNLLPPTGLVYPSKNVNYHENGLSKRGGNAIVVAGGGQQGQGIFQFRTPTKTILLFAVNGTVYANNYSTPIHTGMSTQNPICFVQTSVYVFFCDGSTNPQYWDGSAGSSSNVTAASSWTGNMPFQFVIHTLAGSGAGDRLWAVTPDALWYSKLNTPTDFFDSDAGTIPIDSIGGLTGAYDLGGQLFAFSKTQTFLIEDQSSTIANWGYQNALWEGGVGSWRLIAKAYNGLYLMAEDGIIYNLFGVLTTGAYNAQPLNRPAFVDVFIRNNVALANIQNFHVAYDRKLRALKWFMQTTGSQNNIALVYFIDKKPANAWIIHDNELFTSGYNACASCDVRVSAGSWTNYTIDYSGNIWALEQSSRDDNRNPYPVHIKTKPQDLDIPRNNKHWLGVAFRGDASGTVNLTLNIWVEGTQLASQAFTIDGSGATFNDAFFDTATFAADQLTFDTQYIGVYGRDLQVEFVNSQIGVDFFFGEILFFAKPLGIKVAV